LLDQFLGFALRCEGIVGLGEVVFGDTQPISKFVKAVLVFRADASNHCLDFIIELVEALYAGSELS